MTPETLTPAEVRRQALVAYNAGLCVVPPKEDGTKAPLGEWREYQSQRPSESVLDGWYTHSRTGLGLVCGAISGNLEVLEFDDRAAYEEFRELAEASGLGGLVNRIEAAYCEESPSGGIHWLYRCEKIGGNAKLARRPKLPDEMAHTQDRVKVLIETRGEGGFIITAPSFGDVHPSGQPYRLLQGAFGTIATITPKERAGLFELARTFDQMPKQTVQERPPPRSETSGVRPGDDFNARGEWANILVPHGWRPVFQRGE
ncbi:MAG TPA: bifunctional DNA primase/polymerase, partial [Dehalococcoidia bacterium]|nr:bifunctional DNA primase/polymerase [Dehalococcoidia bacterium]